MSCKREERGVDFFNFTAETAFKLVECGVCTLFTLSGYKSHNAFGFGKVKLTVKKSSFCEFARCSRLSPVLQNETEYFFQKNNTAVAIYLNDILACVAVRRTKNKTNDLINGCFTVKNPAEISSVALGRTELFAVYGNKNSVGNFSCIFSRYSDNSNAAGTQRCGYGGDC